MSDIKGFEADLKKFGKQLGIRTEVVIKKVVLDLFTKIVKKTPVDTGRARASWVIGVENPDNSPILSPSFTASQASAFALSELSELSRVTPFSTVFISNSLPYIEELENGSSDQSPSGMVAVSLAEVERGLKRITDDF